MNSSLLIPGDKVFFIEGQYKGQFGIYRHHARDSGYWVPHVKLEGQDWLVRPWEDEIVCERILVQDVIDATKKMNDLVNLYEDLLEAKNA